MPSETKIIPCNVYCCLWTGMPILQNNKPMLAGLNYKFYQIFKKMRAKKRLLAFGYKIEEVNHKTLEQKDNSWLPVVTTFDIERWFNLKEQNKNNQYSEESLLISCITCEKTLALASKHISKQVVGDLEKLNATNSNIEEIDSNLNKILAIHAQHESYLKNLSEGLSVQIINGVDMIEAFAKALGASLRNIQI